MWYYFSMTDKDILNKYTNTKNQPMLLPYIDDIKFLLDNNASQQSILEFLQKEKKLTLCKSTISVFIKNHINKEPFVPEEKEPTEKKEVPKKLKDSVFED